MWTHQLHSFGEVRATGSGIHGDQYLPLLFGTTLNAFGSHHLFHCLNHTISSRDVEMSARKRMCIWLRSTTQGGRSKRNELIGYQQSVC